MGNNRIQTAGFLNQYSPFTLNLENVFFAPRPKIFLQQYRPEADSCSPANSTLLDHLVGCGEAHMLAPYSVIA
jgi:hypothetical protein